MFTIKKPFFLLGIILFFFNSCKFKDPSKYRVFKDNRKWIYDAFFINDKKDTTSKVILILSTIDKFFPDIQQRSISWEYFDSSLNKAIYNTTGVKDAPGNIWLHPPRDEKFYILSFSPFPDYNDACKNNSLKSGGTMGMNKIYNGILINKVIDSQFCRGQHEISVIAGKNIKANFTESYSKSDLGKIIHNYYMNDSLGLIKSHYILHDNTEIILELKKVEGY